MKMFCATTNEIDEADVAVEQILERLDLPKNQLKNSVGLIAMFGEFYDTGVYSAIVNALPFPCIGYSSSFIGSNGEAGEILLSVMVLTSDENTFETFRLGYMDTLNDLDGTRDEVKKLADKVYAKGKPSLIMPYWSMLPDVSSDDMITILDSAFNQVPLYGSVIFSNAEVPFDGFTCVGNSEKLSKEIVLIAIYGKLNPNFMVVSGINEAVMLRNSVKVTKAISNTLYEVNNITTMEYLRSIGIVDDTFSSEAMWVLPSLIENKEKGTSKVRAFMGISPYCPTAFYASGNMEVGNTVSFGQLDADATNESARKAFRQLVETKADCFLGVSCVARSWSNGTEYLREFRDIGKIYENYKAESGNMLNYQIINSGGEICPIKDKDGNLVNTLHNYSLVICYFTDTEV
ncbi:MAG: hypothetical protein LBL93_06450 [Ruminococcus sp.]|jgi:hypothetical protein|nr:hypothetical protein [Ruminococcus sp.]